jgi:hypothetical protein
MTSEPTPEGDLEMLERIAWIKARAAPISEIAREGWAYAATRLSNLASERLSRITIPITSHYDWDRLRINVAHRVEPTLVKWSK